MFTTNIKRSAAALAVTAGLLAAAAPASHAFSFGEHQTGSHSVKAPAVQTSQGFRFYDVLISSYSVKAKPAKGKHGKGKHGKGKHGNVTATYDIRTNRAS